MDPISLFKLFNPKYHPSNFVIEDSESYSKSSITVTITVIDVTFVLKWTFKNLDNTRIKVIVIPLIKDLLFWTPPPLFNFLTLHSFNQFVSVSFSYWLKPFWWKFRLAKGNNYFIHQIITKIFCFFQYFLPIWTCNYRSFNLGPSITKPIFKSIPHPKPILKSYIEYNFGMVLP